MSSKVLVETMFLTPIKVVAKFFSIMIDCVTFGFVESGDKFCLSTGGLNPPKHIRNFIVWNLLIGLLNLAPVSPLDGWHIAEAIFPSLVNVPFFVSVAIFAGFITSINMRSWKVLEIARRDW